jgi:hypothetical protein
MVAKQNVYITLTGKDNVSKTLKNVSTGFKRLRSGASAVGGALLKVGAIAATAAAAIAGGIIAATKAAADEEKGIKSLNAAIASNVKGRTDLVKVEEQVAAQQKKLAFSDGEIRSSLQALLPFTKNTAKAFEIQAVAADLARAKNISLEEASVTIAKAMNGSTRATKELGIALPKTATQAQILGAIQAKVAGQADAYANSTEGQFTKLKNSFDDITETLGAQFLPIANDVAKWANETLLPAIEAALPTIISFGKSFIDGAAAIGRVVIPILQQVVQFVMTNVVPVLKDLAQRFFGPDGIAQSVMKVVGPIAQSLFPVFKSLIGIVGDIIGKIGNLVGVLWGDGKGPLAIAVKLIGGAFGVLGTILGAIGKAIGFVIDLIAKMVKAIVNSPLGQIIGAVGGFVGDLLSGTRAGGGPVSRNRAYLVGERGPEVFAPATAGRIIPNHRLAAPAMTSGAPGGISGGDLRGALSGMTVVMDGNVVGSLIDNRLATRIRGARTSTRQ